MSGRRRREARGDQCESVRLREGERSRDQENSSKGFYFCFFPPLLTMSCPCPRHVPAVSDYFKKKRHACSCVPGIRRVPYASDTGKAGKLPCPCFLARYYNE